MDNSDGTERRKVFSFRKKPVIFSNISSQFNDSNEFEENSSQQEELLNSRRSRSNFEYDPNEALFNIRKPLQPPMSSMFSSAVANITENDARQLFTIIQKSPKNLVLQPARAKIAKKFAPQTCGPSYKFSSAASTQKLQAFRRTERETREEAKETERYGGRFQGRKVEESEEELRVEKAFKQRVGINETEVTREKSRPARVYKSRIEKEESEDSEEESRRCDFKTAGEELELQQAKKYGNSNTAHKAPATVGLKRKRGVRGKFVSPVVSSSEIEVSSSKRDDGPSDQPETECLKNIDPKMVELIRGEIMYNGPQIGWDDIAGLEFAKTSIQEAVVWPLLRPDIFTGLRRPPKAILLYGPPGTGKTLIGKCVASQSKSTFFSISASSLTSKWIGDGEKMVRALFCVARCHQPAVIFIDEIDSLLSQRSDTEHECSRRIKTEFLVQLDGATTDSEERLLVIGATNRPQDLDEAARRRFVKRLYIPLPVHEARGQLVKQLIKRERHLLSENDFTRIAQLSEGYSGADLKSLCCEAALGPIRSMDFSLIQEINAADVRAISMNDFETAFQRVKSSVAEKDLDQYILWNQTYGSNSSF